MTDDPPIPPDSFDVTRRQERLIILASALDEKIRQDHNAKKSGLLGLLLKILPPAEPFPSDCLDEVVACVRETDLQLTNDEAVARKSYRVQDGKPEDYWIFFQSSPATWKALGGRAGWLVLCSSSLKQKAFFITAMN